MTKILGVLCVITLITMPVQAADYKDQAGKTVDDYLAHIQLKKSLENQRELLMLKTEIAKAYNECLAAGAAAEDCDVTGTLRTISHDQSTLNSSMNNKFKIKTESSINEPASIRLLRELSAEIKGVNTKNSNGNSLDNSKDPEDIPKFIKVIGKKAYFSTSSGIIGAGIDTALPGGYTVKNFNLTTSFLEKNGIEYIVSMDWQDKKADSKPQTRRLKYAKPIR